MKIIVCMRYALCVHARIELPRISRVDCTWLGKRPGLAWQVLGRATFPPQGRARQQTQRPLPV